MKARTVAIKFAFSRYLKHDKVSRQLSYVLFVIACLVLLPPIAMANEMRQVTDWMRLDASKTKEWETRVQDDPRFVEIYRSGSPTPSQKILLIYRKSSSAYDTAVSKILSVMAEKDASVSFTAVFIGRDGPFAKTVLQAAEGNGYDLVYAVGSSAVRKVLQHYKGGVLPVVTVCAKDPVIMGQLDDYETGSNNNFAFTSLNAPTETLLKYVRTLKPGLKNVAILYAKQNESARITQYEPMAALSDKMSINILGLGVEDRRNTVKELSSLIPGAIASMKRNDPHLKNSIFWVTGSTSVFQEIATINELASNIPVLSAVTNVVNEGHDTAVMSIGISFESNAHLAALYGLNILDGADPGSMPVGLVSPPDIAISFLKAREIKMPIPFEFFEIANYIYDNQGVIVREAGKTQISRAAN